jgi:adenosylcobinamide-phosphate synthase
VGRDTDRMDAGACRRAAVESLSESLTDGFTSPLFWYVLLGLPGVVLFKVVSTMDSMVGYKTPRYLKFGWFGARADDVMNYVPARITWLLIALTAASIHGFSMLKALRIGWTQHAILPGPNSGWSEAATAGALQRRIVGPIWLNGEMKTDVWIGDPADPPIETRLDLMRAMLLVTATALAATMLAVFALIVI